MLAVLRNFFLGPPQQPRRPLTHSESIIASDREMAWMYEGTGYNPPRSHDQSKVYQAVDFLREALKLLADRHAAALTQVDFLRDDMKAKIKEFDQRLAKARYLVLQQADAQWGEKITNLALHDLDLCPRDFRADAKKAK